MKKHLHRIAALVLCPLWMVCILSACLTQDAAVTTPGNLQPTVSETTVAPTESVSFTETVDYLDSGVSISLPEHWMQQRFLSDPNAFIDPYAESVDFRYMPNAALDILDEISDQTDDAAGELFFEAWAMSIPLASILVETRDGPDSEQAEYIRQLFEIEVPVGEQSGYVYTFHYSEIYNTEILEEGERALFNDLVSELPLIPGLVRLLPRAGAAADAVVFSSVTLGDEPLDSDFFQGYAMTAVFVWAMWQAELPSLTVLASLQEDLPEGVGLLGVVSDVTEKGATWDRAAAAVEAAELTFPNIVNDDSMMAMMREILVYPSFLFVDSRGRLVGGPALAELSDSVACLALIAERLDQAR